MVVGRGKWTRILVAYNSAANRTPSVHGVSVRHHRRRGGDPREGGRNSPAGAARKRGDITVLRVVHTRLKALKRTGGNGISGE